MNDAMRKTFLVKIIPPDGYSVYRVAFTRRHVAALAAVVVLLLIGAAGLHTWQLQKAEANVRALQALTGEQQSQLRSIDAQADALSKQLQNVEKQNAEIRRMIGADRGGRSQHAMVSAPHAARAGFAQLQARLKRLARASAATTDDAQHLEALALRVLNVRRLASIARARMIAEIPSIMPVDGASLAAGYGWRTNPWPEFHKGVDLAADYGAPVRASAAGTVVSAGWDAGGFGNKVDIDHGNGYHTWYCHLSKIDVAVGAHVTKGEPIALVGSTGESTGPHLHYQVMKDGQPIDPQPFLTGVPAKVLATLPDTKNV